MQNEERIAVLELQYRNMKRIVLGVSWVISLNFAICSLIIVGFFVSTTNAPDVIQAKSFEVVNDEGKEVAILSEYDGWGVLVICNKNGEPVARLRAANYLPHDGAPESGGGVLKIFNKDFKQVVHIGVDEDGSGVVQTLNGKDEEISVEPSEE